MLNSIIREAGESYRVEAHLLKNQLKEESNNGPIARKFDLKTMAHEIHQSKQKEPTDPDLQSPPRINKSSVLPPSSQGYKIDKASQSTSPSDFQSTQQSSDHIQGFASRTYPW